VWGKNLENLASRQALVSPYFCEELRDLRKFNRQLLETVLVFMNYTCKSMHPNTDIQRGREGGEREREMGTDMGLQGKREREKERERERENMRSTPSIRAVYFLD